MNVYDFDKTIYKNDSTADFCLFCIKRHPRAAAFLPGLIWGFVKFYVFRSGIKTEFKQKMFRFLKYIEPEKDIVDFWNCHTDNIKEFYLRQRRDDDVIISASPEFLLEPVCRNLGIKRLICSRVDVKTGMFSGLNCHGEEKVIRFKKEYGDAHIDCFYSDSYSDTPMAKLADKAYLVRGEQLLDWDFDR